MSDTVEVTYDGMTLVMPVNLSAKALYILEQGKIIGFFEEVLQDWQFEMFLEKNPTMNEIEIIINDYGKAVQAFRDRQLREHPILGGLFKMLTKEEPNDS